MRIDGRRALPSWLLLVVTVTFISVAGSFLAGCGSNLPAAIQGNTGSGMLQGWIVVDDPGAGVTLEGFIAFENTQGITFQALLIPFIPTTAGYQPYPTSGVPVDQLGFYYYSIALPEGPYVMQTGGILMVGGTVTYNGTGPAQVMPGQTITLETINAVVNAAPAP